ncbi:MAG TPA: hypothetical protein VFP72_16705 [Kineosporiaceae bacterium]|nr:hypothetical protein [Kineosporiaceae bacterium]
MSARQTRGKAPARTRSTGTGRPRPARQPARRSSSGKSGTRVVQVSGIGSLITLNLFGRGSSGRGGLFTRLRRVATSAGKAFGRSAMTAAGAARGRSGSGGGGGGGGRSFDDFAASRPDLFDDPTGDPAQGAGEGDGMADDVDPAEGFGGGAEGGHDAPAPQSSPVRSRRVDRAPETDADRRFFDLRASGYRGPIARDGYAVEDPAGPTPPARREGPGGVW